MQCHAIVLGFGRYSLSLNLGFEDVSIHIYIYFFSYTTGYIYRFVGRKIHTRAIRYGKVVVRYLSYVDLVPGKCWEIYEGRGVGLIVCM